jgi:hypothetical protein
MSATLRCFERANSQEASIVDQAFGRAIDLLCRADCVFELAVIHDIHGCLPDPRRGQAIERLGVARNEKEGMILGREFFSKRTADAVTGTRYHHERLRHAAPCVSLCAASASRAQAYCERPLLDTIIRPRILFN